MELQETQKVLNEISQKTILVIGDVMLDHYLRGKVDRISPEAPVPVVEVNQEEYRLGGAANVALNIVSLGARVKLVGLIGNDWAGTQIRQMLVERNLNDSYLYETPGRPSTIKTRVIAHHQQMIRIDREVITDISASEEASLLQHIISALDGVDAVILEDYNKGLLTASVIRNVILECREKGIIVTVDPKFKNFFEYKNCTVFKPNLVELQKNLGITIEGEEQLIQAIGQLQDRIQADHVIITRGEKGLTVFSRNGDCLHIPTFAIEVFDVSGAGDTVISMLTLCLAGGSDIRTSAILANHAAGVVCGKMGTSVVYPGEILQSVKEH